MTSADSAWLAAIKHVCAFGCKITSREKLTLETLSHTEAVDMSQPVVTVKGRNLNYSFMARECHWILSGDDTLEGLGKHASKWEPYSDDGVKLFGAYGPRLMEQKLSAINALVLDPNTRQSVITFWRTRPPTTKNVPCTTSLQFLIRGMKIHCIATMRSSDLWMGWPYDVFTFSMITAMVGLELRERAPDAYQSLDLGHLYITAGSQHIYEEHIDKSMQSLDNPEFREFRDISLTDLDNPGHLMYIIWMCAQMPRGQVISIVPEVK